MAINKLDKVLSKRGKRAGIKNEPVREDGPAKVAVEATSPDVTGNTDSSAKQEAKPGTGNRNGNKNDAGKKSKKVRKVLRQAVKEAIRAKSTEIAKALVHKVVDGDKRSTEMMFSLIEKKKKGGALSSRHGGLTAADLLGSEEEWESETDEAVEGQSELGTGGKEPEGQ